jgi:hypothetical protein
MFQVVLLLALQPSSLSLDLARSCASHMDIFLGLRSCCCDGSWMVALTSMHNTPCKQTAAAAAAAAANTPHDQNSAILEATSLQQHCQAN